MRYPNTVTSDVYDQAMLAKMPQIPVLGAGHEGTPDGLLYVIVHNGFGAGAYIVFKREQIDELISLLQDVKAEA